MRPCARSGCNSPATATLTYDRIALTAYLADADDPTIRTPGDLCERHTARLVLPRQWHLDDRRTATVGAATAVEPPAPAKRTRAKKLRVVPSAPGAESVGATKAARSKPRAKARPKWAEVVEPSLFDTPAPAPVAPAAPAAETATVATDDNDVAWMPRFGPDSELDGVLDAKTPLLRRAFGTN